jgi:hypothetical protein
MLIEKTPQGQVLHYFSDLLQLFVCLIFHIYIREKIKQEVVIRSASQGSSLENKGLLALGVLFKSS